MATTDQLLDLAPGIGQRASDVRWDVLDKALTPIGTTSPDVTPPTVALNINRTIKRDLSGLRLNASVQADLDPFGHRLAPVWVLENGAEFPLGVFLFGSMDRVRWEWGLDARVSAVDQTIILDQAITQSVALNAGDDVRAAILLQFATAAVPLYAVDPGIVTQIGEPILWPIGTSRLRVVNELAAMAGAYSVFFDNAGVGRVDLIPDLGAGAADHTYASAGRIIAGSMVESDDLLDAPNQFLVIDSSAQDSPVVGLYEVPASAPHSFDNRGFYVVDVIPEQGLATVEQANARAYAAYVEAQGGYQWVQFSSPPDPRHDTFDSVDYLGSRYREQGWSLPLREGAEMTHDLRRVFAA